MTTTTIKRSTTSMSSSKQRTTLFLNPLIVKHAKAQALVEDISLTKLVEMALVSYLPKEIIIKKDELFKELNP